MLGFDKAIKGTVVSRELPSLPGGSHEITFIFPCKNISVIGSFHHSNKIYSIIYCWNTQWTQIWLTNWGI